LRRCDFDRLSRKIIMMNGDNEVIEELRIKSGRYRYVILVIVALQLSFTLGNVITFNAAFVAMHDLTTSPLYPAYLNKTLLIPEWETAPELSLSEMRFVWTPMQKALSFAGAFGGNVVCVQILAQIIRRVGVHKTMVFIGYFGAFITSTTPVVLTISFPLFIVFRFLNGMTFSMLFTVAGVVTNDWAPLAQRGLFIAVLTGHVEMAALFTMPVAGAVASKIGWPYAFFMSGFLLAVVTSLFLFLYRDSPSAHPFVGEMEVKKINCGKSKQQASGSSTAPPYRSIFSSPVIWASWVAVIGTFFVSQFTISWSPIYLNNVLQYSPAMTGVISVVPLACQLLIKFFSGLMSDKLHCVDDVTKLRLFNSIALVGGGVFFAIASIITPSGHWVDTFFSLAPVALLGFHAGGYPKCLVIVSRQYSAFVMSVVQMVSCGTMFVGSFIIPLIAPENTFDQWKKVFILYASMLVVTNTVFVIFAKAKAASWTEEDHPKRTNRVASIDGKLSVISSQQ
ncbi:hypothetical protein PMAYCL1PPCAC_31904, partial [Pristionchus mayeri]